jgi:hypothetical protein
MNTTHPSPAMPDFTNSQTLRELIATLTATDSWRTSPIARELMLYAMRKYAPVAKAWHREPADAAYAAFLAFRAPTTSAATDPWAVVTRAVQLSLAADEHADRLMTSSDKARRPSKRPTQEPVRAGDYEEFLYDIRRADPAEPDEEADAVEDVIRTAGVFLVTASWPARTIGVAVEYICNRITSLSSRVSAIDVLTADTAMAVRLGYLPSQWAALLGLLLGTKSTRTPGADSGILARVLMGDTITELLDDAELLSTARAAAPKAS